MITKRRMFYASLGAATAFSAVIAVGSYVEMQTPYLNVDGTPDNAPVRVFGLLLYIAPLLFVIITTVTFAATALLQHFMLLRRSVLASIVSVVSVALGFVMVLDRPFGLRDRLYYFAGFSMLIFVTLSISAVVWWIVATRSNRSVAKGALQATRPFL